MPQRWLAALIGFAIAAVAAVGVAQAPRSPSPESSGALAEVAVAVLLLLVAGVLTLQIVGALRAALVERRQAERAPGPVRPTRSGRCCGPRAGRCRPEDGETHPIARGLSSLQ